MCQKQQQRVNLWDTAIDGTDETRTSAAKKSEAAVDRVDIPGIIAREPKLWDSSLHALLAPQTRSGVSITELWGDPMSQVGRGQSTGGGGL
jgi:hypothetical protein